MGVEIEKKFLVIGNSYEKLGKGILYTQAYICTEKERVVRVRIAGDKAFITIKGKALDKIRPEYEYEIPVNEAQELINSDICRKPAIIKYRYTIEYNGSKWEVDKFTGDNQGLVIAEIELQHPDMPFEKPEWIGEEVTNDYRFSNSNLVSHPYSKWKNNQVVNISI